MRRRMNAKPLLLAAALCVGIWPAAQAERADRDKPMNIEADHLVHDDAKQSSTFSGNVHMTKGTIVMRGARLVVTQDTAGNQNGVLYADGGKRGFFRQKREGLNEFMEGEAQTIYYDSQQDTARLVGQAEIRRLMGEKLADQINGNVIVYNSVTEVFTVDGGVRQAGAAASSPASGRQGGRVRAVLTPRGSAGGAAPKASPTAPEPSLQSSPRLQPGAKP